jgi:hypothetical protein
MLTKEPTGKVGNRTSSDDKEAENPQNFQKAGLGLLCKPLVECLQEKK